jgi:hypothetical protein
MSLRLVFQAFLVIFPFSSKVVGAVSAGEGPVVAEESR